MIEGLYDVAIDTPKHHKRGTLALKSAGASISAQLTISEMEPFDFQGTCADKDFTFEGSGEFGSLGAVDYTAHGSTWGNSVTVECASSAGRIELFGTRLSTSAGDFKSSHEYMMKASTGEFDADDNTMYSGLYADGG